MNIAFITPNMNYGGNTAKSLKFLMGKWATCGDINKRGVCAMKIEIPELSAVALVRAISSGKTSFATSTSKSTESSFPDCNVPKCPYILSSYCTRLIISTRCAAIAVARNIIPTPCASNIRKAVDAIAAKGHTFTPATFHNDSRKTENFKQMQLLVLDIDKGLSWSDTHDRAEKFDIPVNENKLLNIAPVDELDDTDDKKLPSSIIFYNTIGNKLSSQSKIQYRIELTSKENDTNNNSVEENAAKNRTPYRSDTLDSIISRCQLFRELESDERRLHHHELYGIATNLINVELGRSHFLKILNASRHNYHSRKAPDY
jgi:hypothetical protein